MNENTQRARAATPLARLITEKRLRALAGDRYYERGAAYFASSAVASLVESGETVIARVLGSDEYKVTLKAGGDELVWDCTCPLGEDGEFCKHAVATGLAWLDGRKSAETPPEHTGKSEIAAIRAHLAGMSREALVELLMEQVTEDDALLSRLRAQAVRRAADPKALKDAIRKALAVSGFVDYRGMRALIQRAGTVADLLRGLIADGHATLAAELAAYAMQRGLAAYERTDDSSGSFGGLMREIASLHLDACRRAKPEPEALGKVLFQLRLRDHWGFFEWKDYAPLLGEAGRTAYRKLAENEWATVPARAPGDGGGRFDTEHFLIKRIMEELASETGDIDVLVAIKSRDLASAYSFLQIAETLVEAGRRDEALAWVERGRAAFPKRTDSRLIEFLVAEYVRRKRFAEATTLAWAQFAESPGLSGYKLLMTSAGGAKAWAPWREKALALLREPAPKDQPRYGWAPGGHSLLVEIFLWEGDSDAALAAAREGGCSVKHWFDLARAREKDHPAEAAEIYRVSIDGIVGRTNNGAYDDAVELVVKVRDLMRRANQERPFAEWLGELRVRHKAKRNFMQRLERAVGKAG